MLQKTWKEALQALEEQIGRDPVHSWFQQSRLVALDGQEACITVPTRLHREYIHQHYLEHLKAALGVPEACLQVEATSTEDLLREEGLLEEAPVFEEPPAAPQPAAERHPAPPAEEDAPLRLNPAYTFDTYVVGPCNNFAHAACRGVADRPAEVFNPLFLHGPVGVGKTHLIQAVAHSLLERQPDLRIVYLSCEQFVNHFIAAVKSGDPNTFRLRYRQADVLVVDDIHLLSNKARTQEEFFHTFNTLHNARKQIVLSSDSPPQDIPQLHNRLVSRFQSGLVAEIEPPCFETRVAILQAKAQRNQVPLDVEVAKFLAEQVTTNVRELEGTLIRLLFLASLQGRKVDLGLAQEVVSAGQRGQARIVRIDDILDVVTRRFGVKVSDLQSKRRTQSVVVPRQVAMSLARRLTRMSLEEIGGHFGGKDHTTVLYALDRVKDRASVDSDFAALVASLEREIRKNLQDGPARA